MKIYLIEFEYYDYDQYDAFVVAAESEEDAIKVIEEKYPKSEEYSGVCWEEGYKVKEITNPERGIILDSFNPG